MRKPKSKKSVRARVYDAFMKQPRTIAQVSGVTKINENSVRWCVKELRADKKIYLLRWAKDIGRIEPNNTNPDRYRPWVMLLTTNLEQAYHHYLNLCPQEWGLLCQDDQERMMEMVKDYVRNWFNDSGVAVPGSLAETWKNIKNIIDKEVGL